MSNALTIAVSKGRTLEEALPVLAQAGIVPLEDPLVTRKLILPSSDEAVRLVIVRAADVPTYVQFGAADLGVVGKDVLMEHGGTDLYELIDLAIARCRMVVAEPRELALADDPSRWTRLRIATKYPYTTRRHFASKGIQTEVIKLYGSMELAPLSGLADRIVDLVSTGQTLAANALVEVEHIAHISARLVANIAAMRTKQPQMRQLIDRIERGVH
ncbi:MAG: ATP phosphoribosyltransferase [Gammaproteobacteria bacterium]|nr:ATP phosphoribosyltransferase [Gammaproteobacteria bacterium]NIV73304.1 ATP phosphoribosyltransferase [Gammaproteobacteria bacterium]